MEELLQNRIPESQPMLSSEELRNRVYLRLTNHGVFDELRTQLRQRITEEMLRNSVLSSSQSYLPSLPSYYDYDDVKLQLQVSNWLVLDHLQRCNLPCTLSTFITESGSKNSTKMSLNIEDLLKIFSVPPDSIQYKLLKEDYVKKGNKSFIFNVVHHFILSSMNSRSKVVWTSFYRDANGSVRSMDDTFLEKQEELRRKEHRLLEQLENEYREKEKIFIEEERKLREEMQKEKMLHDQELTSQRQLLLKEIDSLKSWREEEQNEIERRKSRLKIEDEILSHKMEVLKQKEEALKNTELNIDHMIENKVHAVRHECWEQLKQKTEAIEKLKSELNREHERTEIEKQKTLKLQEDLLSKKEMVNQLQAERDALQRKYSKLMQQNTVLLDELDQKADYNLLELETQKLKKEADLLKMRLVELEKELRGERQKNQAIAKELASEINRPSIEVLQLQQQLVRRKEIQKLNEAAWNETRQKMQNELDDIRQKFQAQLLSIKEQQKQIENMRVSIDDLRTQFNRVLKEIQEAISVTSVLQNKSEIQQRTGFPTISLNEALDEDNFKPASMVPYSVNSQVSGTMNTLPQLETGTVSKSPQNAEPLNFITYAKQRITLLQLEADALGRKYKGFLETQMNATDIIMASQDQQRVISTKSSPTLSTSSYSERKDSPETSLVADFGDSYAETHLQHVKESDMVVRQSALRSTSAVDLSLSEHKTDVEKQHKDMSAEAVLQNEYKTDDSPLEVAPSETSLKYVDENLGKEDNIATDICGVTKAISIPDISKVDDDKNESTSTQNATKTSLSGKINLHDTWNLQQKKTPSMHEEPKEDKDGNTAKSLYTQPKINTISKKTSSLGHIDLDDAWKSQQDDIKQRAYRRSSTVSQFSNPFLNRSRQNLATSQQQATSKATFVGQTNSAVPASRPVGNVLDASGMPQPKSSYFFQDKKDQFSVPSGSDFNKFEDRSTESKTDKARSDNEIPKLGNVSERKKLSKSDDSDKNKSSDSNISAGSITEDILQDEDDEW